VLVVTLVGAYFGVDPRTLLQALDQGSAEQSAPAPTTPAEDQQADFVSAVLASTEDAWHQVFQELGAEYREPKLVLFRDQVASACGGASAAVGPFYCPSDHKLYLDLSFFEDLRRRFGAPGDFAQAYVIAHEVGHHVQSLLGTEGKMRAAQRGAPASERNALSVRLELQADCYAGLWAKVGQKQRKFLQPGDIEEAVQAANAIGDDRLQKQSQGTVVPESFTHGSSAQRIHWFKVGFDRGTLEACDTFTSQ